MMMTGVTIITNLIAADETANYSDLLVVIETLFVLLCALPEPSCLSLRSLFHTSTLHRDSL